MINLSKIKSKPLRRLAMIPTVLVLFVVILPLLTAYDVLSIFVNSIAMTREQFIEYFGDWIFELSRTIKAIKECWNDSYNGKI